MKPIFLAAAAAAVAATGWGQQAARPPESLSNWLYYKDVPISRDAGTLADFVLDLDILNAARTDHADVRLYDAVGREIPYVLRVRREVDTTNAFTAREFNRGADNNSSQVSFDMGGQSEQHNEVEIETAGENFRRLAEVQGSDDGSSWSTLATGAILFRFTANGKSVEKNTIAYPVSRYRYLRIKIERDTQVDRTPPEVKSVRIRRSVRIKGEMVPFHGFPVRDADRANGRPASVWRIDLGGRIPFERVILSVGDAVFARPFQLEAVDDPSSPVMLASGELVRREDARDRQPTIEFHEQFARRLKLTVTDDRNPPLPLIDFGVQGAAREIIFRPSAAGAGPVRVYYGNYRAMAPRYDLAAELQGELNPAPVRLTAGAQHENPAYRPQPKPFSERMPWLVYVVLGTAAVVLAAILLNIVRISARQAEVEAG